MDIINPATEAVITSIADDNPSSLARKFELLKSAAKTWRQTTLQERIGILNKFYELLDEEKESLANTLTAEVGKPIKQSRNEINGARVRIKWMLENAEKYLADEWMTLSETMKEKTVYEPLGVICNISAWNYPWLVGVNVFIPALLAGNAVMYKPSEFATLTGLEIERLLSLSGLPAEVLVVAVGGKETGAALLDLPFDGYFFTGSYKTGKYIYEKVAPKMVPCQLELGGKDPLYVADDVADIKAVAASTADGAFYNNGQSCCAVERIYVHEKIYDEYVDAFVTELRSWKIGFPMDDQVYFGPLTRKDQLHLLENQVQDAVKKNAALLCGGKRISQKGYYFEPTVITNVNHEMDVMREETFGPLIGIMKVRDDQEALQLMQDTEYGLTASVYSSHPQRAERILSQLDTGTGYWNCCDRLSPAVPWSGRRHSGIGATLSHQGLRAFTKPKAYHLRG
jgi:acyl-CoA reductase-like NAD-dependent aldehyde dehydrogenase